VSARPGQVRASGAWLRTAACLAVVSLLVVAVPRDAAAATGYVPETSRSLDYTYTVVLPSGVRVAANRTNGTLAFRRRGPVLARARTCQATSDPSGLDAMRDEAGAGDVALRRIRSGVYAAGREFWVAVRGGSCLRFARTASGSAALARSLALRTRAELGRGGAVRASDPAAVALVRRARGAAAAAGRIVSLAAGGICRGRGLTCSSVTSPGELVGRAELDTPARYQYAAFSLPGMGTLAIITRGRSTWLMSSVAELVNTGACWIGPIPTDGDAALTSGDLAMDLPSQSWRLSYAKPIARPDGTTTITYTGYFQRGVAVVGADGRLLEEDYVERGDGDPLPTVSAHETLTYPPAITQVQPQPLCS
jgi:hypothetical protein